MPKTQLETLFEQSLLDGHNTIQSFAVLGVNRESPRAEISKAYRKLAGRWHPDRFQKREEKEEAEKTFLKIAAAYDVLKDEESREEYNYMLDHPEEMWQNYYRYYRRRMAPKVSILYGQRW